MRKEKAEGPKVGRVNKEEVSPAPSGLVQEEVILFRNP